MIGPAFQRRPPHGDVAADVVQAIGAAAVDEARVVPHREAPTRALLVKPVGRGKSVWLGSSTVQSTSPQSSIMPSILWPSLVSNSAMTSTTLPTVTVGAGDPVSKIRIPGVLSRDCT